MGESHLGVEAIGSRQPAGQHRVRATGLEFVDRVFQRVERRGAGGVEREVSATEAEGTAEYARGQTGHVPVDVVDRSPIVHRRRLARGLEQRVCVVPTDDPVGHP